MAADVFSCKNPADYYTNAITNHYARIVRATTIDGRGYAFPYDDVAPAGGADQSGPVSDPAPALLTMTLALSTDQASSGPQWASALPRARWAAWSSLRRI